MDQRQYHLKQQLKPVTLQQRSYHPPEQRAFVEPGLTTRESTLGPGGPVSSLQHMEAKTQKDSRKAEEPELAGALLRQASRQFTLHSSFSYLSLLRSSSRTLSQFQLSLGMIFEKFKPL